MSERRSIEGALAGNPGVLAALVGSESSSGQPNDVAYVLLSETTKLTVAELEVRLRKAHPEHTVSSFVIVRRPSPAVHGQIEPRLRPSANDVSAESQILEVVAGVWSQVLGVEAIADGANLLDLGGHSLHAMQIVSRLEEMFQTRLSWPDVLRSSTPAGLVATLVASEGAAGRTANIANLIRRFADMRTRVRV